MAEVVRVEKWRASNGMEYPSEMEAKKVQQIIDTKNALEPIFKSCLPQRGGSDVEIYLWRVFEIHPESIYKVLHKIYGPTNGDHRLEELK